MSAQVACLISRVASPGVKSCRCSAYADSIRLANALVLIFWTAYLTLRCPAQQVASTAPLGVSLSSLLAGTPFSAWYFRALGARVGRGARISTSNVLCADLLTIGDEATVASEVGLVCYRVERDRLILGPVEVGAGCTVGPHTHLDVGSRLGDCATICCNSLLPAGCTVPAGEHWGGAPARRLPVPPAVPPAPPQVHALEAWATPVLLALAMVLVAAIPVGVLLTTTLTYIWLRDGAGGCSEWGCFAYLPALTAQYSVTVTVVHLALKWVLCGRIRAGTFSRCSVEYVRHWFADHIMEQVCTPFTLSCMHPSYSFKCCCKHSGLLVVHHGCRS